MKRFAASLVLTASISSCVTPCLVGQMDYEQTVPVTVQEDLITEQPMDENLETVDDVGVDEASEIELAIAEMNQKMEEISNIDDKYEWYLAYKEVINDYKDIIDPPKTIYDYYTDEELDLFFRVIEAEIGGKYSFEQKCNVASVILNRIEHERFGNSMNEVLIPSQFQTIRNGSYKKVEVSDLTILACEYAFEIEDTTDGCLFFDSNNTLRYKFSFNDGAHNFYKLS